MAIADGDILRVTAKTVIGTDEQDNVYHLVCQVTTPPTDAEVLTAVIDWLDDAYAYVIEDQSTGLEYATVRVDNLTQDTTLGEDGWSSLTTGSSASQTMALQVAPVCRFLTNVLGSQGRKFLAGYTTAAHSSRGLLTAGALANMIEFISAILPGVSIGSDADLLPGNWNNVLERFVPWANGVANSLLGTQRRRQIGSGD